MTTHTTTSAPTRIGHFIDQLWDLGNPAMGLQHLLVAGTGATLALLTPGPDALIWWPLAVTAIWVVLLSALLMSGVDGYLLGFHPGPFVIALLGPSVVPITSVLGRPELHHAACLAIGVLLITTLPLAFVIAVRRRRSRSLFERAVERLVDELASSLTADQLTWCADRARERISLPSLNEREALVHCARRRGTLDLHAIAQAAPQRSVSH